MQIVTRRLQRLLSLVLLAGWLGHGSPLPAATQRASLGQGMVAALTDAQELFVEAPPRRGEGLYAYAERLTGDKRGVRHVTRVNGKRPRRLLAGVRYRVAYAHLTDHYKLAVIRALFPQDQALAVGWEHVVTTELSRLTLWRLADWLTGEGQNYIAIREHNELSDEELTPGQRFVIPGDLLRPVFRAALPQPEVAHGLEYLRTEDGDFGVYRLKKGEALYSAVVVRYTGGTFAEDVNKLAAELATLNDITDVTDMPVGQRV
ncbi:MAG: hypothetical protein AAF657_01100, partial [Acidobacteriota bacterium]